MRAWYISQLNSNAKHCVLYVLIYTAVRPVVGAIPQFTMQQCIQKDPEQEGFVPGGDFDALM